MEVIAVAEHDSDFPVAVLKRHEQLDPEFAAEARKLAAWGSISDDELLDAQTFMAWIRKKSYYANKPLRECLENEQYAWSDTLTVE